MIFKKKLGALFNKILATVICIKKLYPLARNSLWMNAVRKYFSVEGFVVINIKINLYKEPFRRSHKEHALFVNNKHKLIRWKTMNFFYLKALF